MDSFLDKVKGVITDFDMLDDGDEVVVGLSGGADSTALLISLHELGYKVKACHLNHCLRGEEADRDEQFCRDLCRKYNISLNVMREDIALYAKKSRQSIETAAREVRYRLFDAQLENAKIATAHTASDTIETMIFHMVRGTGLTGLCSIPPVRGRIIRPLISCTREDIELYLKRKNQDFVVDSTNLSNDYTRNRIRNKIVPVLKGINPQSERSAAELAFRLRQDEDFLQKTAQQELDRAKTDGGFKIYVFLNAHTAIRQRMLKTACRQKGVKMSEFTSKHIEALENLIKSDNPSARIYLPSGFIAKRQYDIFIIEAESSNIKHENSEVFIKNILENSISYNDKTISLKKHKKNYVFYKTFNTFYVDCDTIDMQSCVLRSRKTGDKIRLGEKGCTKTLKKLFIEKKIPSEKRDSLAVIADKNGIIAVEGIGIDISRKPSSGEILEIKIKG